MNAAQLTSTDGKWRTQGRIAELIILAEKARDAGASTGSACHALILGLRDLNAWLRDGHGEDVTHAGLLHDLLQAARGVSHAAVRLQCTALAMNLTRIDTRLLDDARALLQRSQDSVARAELVKKIQEIGSRTPAADVRRKVNQLLYSVNASALKPPQ